MGRPKKGEGDQPGTRERLLGKAIELFSRKGFSGVSVRDITGALGLNEASLYNHFTGKDELLTAIFSRLEERLLEPGFQSVREEASLPGIVDGEGFNLSAFLMEGARAFFARADEELMATWRILVMEEYRLDAAKEGLRRYLLEEPRLRFRSILEALQGRGLLAPGADIEAAAQGIAALYFHFSFQAILCRAWAEDAPPLEGLSTALRLLCAGLVA